MAGPTLRTRLPTMSEAPLPSPLMTRPMTPPASLPASVAAALLPIQGDRVSNSPVCAPVIPGP